MRQILPSPRVERSASSSKPRPAHAGGVRVERVEHVTSGVSVRFDLIEGLLAFVERRPARPASSHEKQAPVAEESGADTVNAVDAWPSPHLIAAVATFGVCVERR